MSFAKKSVSEQDVKQSNSAYIMTSGVYPVTILAAFVDTNEKDSSVINLYVEHQEQPQVIYGNWRVSNNGGGENAIGMKTLNQLLVIADIDECGDPVEMELPIGKGGANKTVAVLEDLADIEVMLRIQLEYTNYNKVIRENKVIRGFYRAGDGATAQEIVNEKDFGETLEKEIEGDHTTKIVYKDGLDADDIKKWIAKGRKSDEAKVASAPVKKTPGFGNKSKFGK